MNAKSHLFLIVSKAKLEGQCISWAYPTQKAFPYHKQKKAFFVETVNRDIGSTHINQIWK